MRSQTDFEKKAAREADVMAALNGLPASFGRNRVLDARTAAAFWGVSLPHWRRLYRVGTVPRPIKVGERKYGWPIGRLIDAQTARATETA